MEMENTQVNHTVPNRFTVSAPGKVILHGEHSVVYGHLAIAASLDLRSRVDIDLAGAVNTQKVVHIVLPMVGIDFTLPVSVVIEEVLSLTANGKWDFSQPSNVDFSRIVSGVQNFLDSDLVPKNLSQGQKQALTTCFFLLAAILHNPEKNSTYSLLPLKIVASSELPVGAGAGSSASFSVCLATAFLYLSSQWSEQPQEFNLDDKTKDLVSGWAFQGERILHGNPSGLDNTICTYGAAIALRRPSTIFRIPLNASLRVLLVDTGASRNTRKIVEQVAELKSRHEHVVSSVMEAMNSLCLEAKDLLEQMDGAHRKQDTDEEVKIFLKMQELWPINQSLLVALGVNHTSLERIVHLAEKQQFRAKLTGAGGGGFALVLVPPPSVAVVSGRPVEADVQWLKTVLEREGFSTRDVILGGPGVQLHLYDH